MPVGYYNDLAKTAATFPTFEGKRWSMPGDWATVDTDGSLHFLGRGSQCINTGGEKVFPEEVEEALKRHPAIRDAAVVGLPEARRGEVICAVIEGQPGARPLDTPEVKAWVRGQLADYKAPRKVVCGRHIGRVLQRQAGLPDPETPRAGPHRRNPWPIFVCSLSVGAEIALN